MLSRNNLAVAKEIEDFPDYVITPEGNVFVKETGNIRKPSLTQNGQVKIILFRDGKRYTKSLALLVARAWLHNDRNPEIYDTPIHLDNDLTNNHVDNLAWRPRWFAIKYQKQYWTNNYRYSTVAVQDVQTGEIFNTLLEVCQRYGYLYMDVIRSCTHNESVFPSWRTFRFVK